MGFYFDQTLCINCRACVVACKDWHDIPAGPASFIRIKTIEKGKYPDLSVHSLFDACFHCAEPACVSACPADAITKRNEDGIVEIDREACMGKDACGMCKDACPYNGPQFQAEDDAPMQKCDLCLDRLKAGKKPICVDACIMRALDAGPIDELRKIYGDIREAEGFDYAGDLIPSIVFKPKKDERNLPVQKTVVSPL